ncbi:MAG: glycosyltransferase family 4 protein, partial [Candidatus Odinarchaeia archaeon]
RYFWIARNLVRLGHAVTVYTMKLEDAPEEEVFDGIKIKRIGIAHPMSHRRLSPLPAYIFNSVFLAGEIIREKYDIIDTNTYIPVFAGNFLSKISRIPHVVTFHDVYWNYWSSSLGRRWANIVGPPIELLLARMASSKIITVSSASKEKLIRYLRVAENRISIIPNGIDLDKFTFKSKISKEPYTITYLGRLVPHKHVDDLIKAFAIIKRDIPEAKLNIIGSGELLPSLKKLSYKISKKDIQFFGYIPDRYKVIKLLSSSTVMVNPSTVEGFGIVLIEGMAAKTPVIAYDLPAYSDFVKNYENAILIPPRDIKTLSKALVNIIQDKSLQKRLIQKGYKTAIKFDWMNIAKLVENEYLRLIKN